MQSSKRDNKFSDLKARKKHSIILSTRRSTSKKIKINKSATKKIRRRKSILIAIFCLAGLVIATTAIVAKTQYYSLFKLAAMIENEDIIIGFQNSAELRPTGGFWGSFAIWEVKNSVLNSELAFETNPYKMDNKILNETNVPLPEPMAQTWQDRPQSFVNANWSFDFSEAARTIEWYFSQGWDRKSDGVIAVSSLALIDLLKLTGEIKIDDENSINSENFTQVMSEKIDEQYWLDPKNKEINEPKTLVKELFPKVIDKLKAVPKLKLISFLNSQLHKGRILAFFNDRGKQRIAKKLNISGEVIDSSSDYLLVVNANLNGGKSSLNVEQEVDYKVFKNSLGKTEASLKITRFHASNLWPQILNRNYQRVIVPLGSKLISANLSGEDITSEVSLSTQNGRTIFGYWFSLSPGEEKTVELTYELPLISDQRYFLIYQKQAGTISEQLHIERFSKKVFDGKFDQLIELF